MSGAPSPDAPPEAPIPPLLPPERMILSYDLDEDGHWRAILDCGHRQHLRHTPPAADRAWVHDPAERAARIGRPLPCRRCARWEAPAGLRLRRSTREFSADDVPEALLRAHRTAAGVWGRVVVTAGALQLWAEGGCERPAAEQTVTVAAVVEIPPGWTHSVRLGPGARFRVDLMEPAPLP